MIQIHQPEIEALIQHRLTAGGFDNIEEVLLQALQDAPLPTRPPPRTPTGPTGRNRRRIPALAAQGHRHLSQSYVLPISDPVEF